MIPKYIKTKQINNKAVISIRENKPVVPGRGETREYHMALDVSGT